VELYHGPQYVLIAWCSTTILNGQIQSEIHEPISVNMKVSGPSASTGYIAASTLPALHDLNWIYIPYQQTLELRHGRVTLRGISQLVQDTMKYRWIIEIC
jgi:hypothetical protein